MTYEEEINLYNWTKETCEFLDEERLYQQHCFDEWLLKICAGVFGVSFAFIEKLIDFSVAVWKPLLSASWFLFALCLVAEIFNFMNSEKLYRLDIISRQNDYDNQAHGKNLPTDLVRKTAFIGKYMNYVSFILFLAGIICLVSFIAKNI